MREALQNGPVIASMYIGEEIFGWDGGKYSFNLKFGIILNKISDYHKFADCSFMRRSAYCSALIILL